MLWLAARDRRTPVLAKLVAGLAGAYVLSPIDFVPDFVPIFGVLDDLIVITLGLWLSLRMVPDGLMDEFRRVADLAVDRPISRLGALLVIGLWVAIGTFIALQLWAMRYW